MNRTMRLPVSRWETFWRRVRNTLRTVFTRGDLTTLFITCLLMVVPVLALNSSLDLTRDLARQTYTWRVSLSQLIPVAICSVLFGFLLSRSHYSEAFALILSAIYAVAVIAAIQVFAAPGNIVERVMAVLTRFFEAFNNSLDQGTFDPYLLVLFLSILIWFLGHNTAWHTFRLDRVWRAILPPGIVLVLNGFYSTDQANIDGYLLIYLFLSILLIIRSHIEAREFDWYLNRVSYQGNWRKLRAWFFRSGAIIGLIMLALAWLAPTGSPEENAKRFQDFLKGDLQQNISQLLNKLFGSLQGSGIASADYYGGDTLTLGGALQLGDQIVMVAKAPPGPRYYWKSRVFDQYTNNTWDAPRQDHIIADTPGLTLNYPSIDAETRKTVSQQITFVSGSSSLLYAAPQPVTFDVPAFVEVDYIDRTQQIVNPGVTRQLVRMTEGDTYNVTSSMSIASAAYLRAVPNSIPAWLRADLELPANITTRTKNLAVQIISKAGAKTNYDKAKAIEQWLRTNIKYNEKIINPPAGRELVDWVLFEQKEGYCTYYASAMIVMLRSLGIPSRMAAGFSQGVYDPANGSFVVRERDAHTWVEVWFGPAGWVEFEPTSAQDNIDRIEPNQQPTTPPPPPTDTPAPTPTPMPTVTPPPGGVVPAASPTPPPPQVTATMTASPPPSNTPQPSPTPTPQSRLPELPRNVQNTLGILLIIAAVIAVLSFMFVALIWWVEYRGLDELSPIGRAYARLAIYARWLGIPLAEANTPLERGRRIVKDVPEGGTPVTSITDMYIHERYARPRANSIREEDNAQDAWKGARRAFIWKQIRRWFRRDKSQQ